MNGLARRLGRRNDRLRREVEGNAENIGVFHVEEPFIGSFLVQIVRLATQRAPDHLLAKQLRPEGANAENMRHGISVPSLREHRDRHDAADRTAELSGLADGVHDLAEQFLIGNVFAGVRVAGALNDFAAKPLNFVGSHAPEIIVERIARFELLAIDQQRVGTWQADCQWFRRNSGTIRGGRSPASWCRQSFLR